MAQALVGLWEQERSSFFEEALITLRDDFSASLGGRDVAMRSSHDGCDDLTIAAFEPYKQLASAYEKVLESVQDSSEFVLSTCQQTREGNKIRNAVISPELGGNYIRRSVWKKITNWQYCTTNLNIHLMTNKLFSFEDVLSGQFDFLSGERGETIVERDSEDEQAQVHSAFHITLGCPAAHEMKYHDGGLRRIFSEVVDIAQKLTWMQAIQAPSFEPLKELFLSHPREAMSLFGSVGPRPPSFGVKDELAGIVRRKMELAKRLDICGSQALGCAVTVIRTLCSLACMYQGKYLDVLARSLSMGFLVIFESMLSTSGDELGMIEDLDVAALWLKLVAVRLVGRTESEGISCDSSSNNSGRSTTASGPILGTGDGVTCYRDMVIKRY